MNENRNQKQERDAKIRCAQFLLGMLQKYGAEIKEKKQEKENIESA